MEFDRLNELLGGSNWKVKRYVKLAIDFYSTKPSRGSSYIPTPEKYSNAKCGLINIRNEDQECFRWCMLYHQSNQSKNDDRISSLNKVEDKYDWSDVTFPASYDDIAHFEEQNQICVFVYAVSEEGEIVKDKDGNGKYMPNRVTWLRIENEDHSPEHRGDLGASQGGSGHGIPKL